MESGGTQTAYTILYNKMMANGWHMNTLLLINCAVRRDSLLTPPCVMSCGLMDLKLRTLSTSVGVTLCIMSHLGYTYIITLQNILKRVKQTCSMFSFVYMLEILFLIIDDVLHKHLCIVDPQHALFLQCLFDVSWWSAWWGVTYIDNRRQP